MCLLLLVFTTAILSSCEGKKKTIGEKTDDAEQLDSPNEQKDQEVDPGDKQKPEENISYDSYQFAENLKNDSFFESDMTDKEIELKNVGITGYIVNGNEVILNGIFYDKSNNKAIPRFNNNPPGRAFVSEYYDKLEMKYDEKYKTTYSATLYIVLKNAKDVKSLKMYVPSEPVLNFEYKVPGTIDEFRSGFIDLKKIKGKFLGLSANASIYPNKAYEIKDAELF